MDSKNPELPKAQNPAEVFGLSPEEVKFFEEFLQDEEIEQPSLSTAIRRREDLQDLPLSFAQQRLWFLDQLEPDSAAYNMPAALRLRGRLDKTAFVRSLHEIVQRHQALHTLFVNKEGEPVQVIAPDRVPEMPGVDLTALTESVVARQVERLVKEEASRPFDLARGPLLRALLLELGEEEQVLLLSFHHIVSDGWSIEIFVREMTVLYDAFSSGRPSPLPPLAIQYADFADWQRQWLSGEVLENELAYWRKQLGGEVPVLELPTDRPRPRLLTPRCAQRGITLPSALGQALEAFGQREGATPFMAWLSVFKVLLYRYTGQRDVLIGTPIANRHRVETEELIGFFVNTLALRTDLGGNPSFRQLLGRVREVATDAYDHQDLPFEKLVEELQPDRNLNTTPLFQVAFIREEASPLQTIELADLSFIPLPKGNTAAKFDLTVTVTEGESGPAVELEYKTDLFDAVTILRMLGHLRFLASEMVATPEARISDLPLLSAGERQLLFAEWNDTSVSFPPQLLPDLLMAQVERTPEAVAVSFQSTNLSYRALDRAAGCWAHRLQELGVCADDRVGVMMERSLDMVVSLLAMIRVGAAYVPIDPSHPDQRLAFLLEDLGSDPEKAAVVLAQPTLRERCQSLVGEVPGANLRVVDVDGELRGAGTAGVELSVDVELPAVAVRGEQAAYMIYTSGSTGRPKGTINSHRAITNRLLWMQDAFGLTTEDRVLQKTPFSFDVSVWEFFWPLITGAQLVVAPPGVHQDALGLVRLIRDAGITTIHFVPAMLQVFLEQREVVGLASLSRVICSGEALPADLCERFDTHLGPTGARLHNLYGPTEAAVDVTWWPCPSQGEFFEVPIGRPIANTKTHVLDRHLRPVPIGVAGELHLGGTQLARGYFRRPGLTAEKFIPDPFSEEQAGGQRLYKTGDLARWSAAGEIEYLGRIDFQVKLRGIRIELGEIETALALHPGVREATVVAREERPGDLRLVAYLVPDEQRAAPVRNLLRLEKEGRLGGLEPYELPNGMAVLHHDHSETDFLYQEIFEQRTYLRHGITLEDGACVFDVGANIGLFALFAAQERKDVAIYGFEPLSPSFEILELNMELYGVDATLFACAVASSPLRTLSEVIHENGVERIDLLKVSIEKAELDVLQGLASDDWSKIQQVVVEVHGFDDRLQQISELLGHQGFELTVEEDERFEKSQLDYLFAIRPGVGQVPSAQHLVEPIWNSRSSLLADVRESLGEQLPEAFVPTAFVVLSEMPLGSSGKVDRKALPAPHWASQGSTGYVAPSSPLEEQLVAVWSEVLGVERVGVHDNFFRLGGHSLLATQVISRVRSTLQVEVALQRVFSSPTVAAMALAVEEARQSKMGIERPSIEVRPRLAELPMSYAQERLWFVDQLNPHLSVYNIPLTLRLVGRLDRVALARSLDEIVRRHEALRTHFESTEEGPLQRVAAPQSVDFPLVDLSGLVDPTSEARRQAQRMAHQAFDLERGPLCRLLLLRLGVTDHVAQVTMHHIVSDGWSTGVLVNEVTELYRSYSRGELSPLPELPIQYADYAWWQRQWLEGERLREEIKYWRQRLAGAPQLLELPTDRPRPGVQTFRGGECPLVLEEPVTETLKSFAQSHGVTLFITLLAAYKALLWRYSGQGDLSVGVPMAGRNRLELEGLIGFFVNTLVLRTELTEDLTFDDFLGRVRGAALEAQDHQEVPFEKLVEELSPQRSLSYSPLFQVVFALQNAPLDAVRLPGLRVEPYGLGTVTAKFDLTLTFFESAGRLLGALEYNSDLFDHATVTRLTRHLTRLLQQAAAAPQQRLWELSLLQEEETHQLLVEWNDRRAKFPSSSTVDLFEAQVDRRPAAAALEGVHGILSYGGLDRDANRLAHHLRGLGVGPGTLVALCLDRSVSAVVAILAILKAGGAYVPLDPQYPRQRLSFILQDTGVAVVLTEGKNRVVLPTELAEWGVRVVDLEAERAVIAACDGTRLRVSRPPQGLAYVMYTSGSTGQPKGVAVTHGNIVRLVRGADYALFDETQTFLLFAPISFDASTFEIWGALLNGGRLAVFRPGPTSLGELAAGVCQLRVTSLWLTAGLFHQMAEENLEQLRSLRQLLAGGDVLLPEAVRKVLENLPDTTLINGYGPTETTTFASCHPMTRAATVGASVSIGRPISNGRILLLDGQRQPVPVGVFGELLIGGSGVTQGYFRRPGLTAQRFIPDPTSAEPGARLYRTGDLARYRSDGAIEFLGRFDRQVKLRGFRIELGEVESVLDQHPEVAEVVVMLRRDLPAGDALVAYMRPAGDLAPEPQTLRDFLGQRLPEYMVPSHYVVLEAMPLTPNSKVDRRALPLPELGTDLPETTYVEPQSAVEELVASIWSQVLGIERVGNHDNFFELGGHSLLATQVMTRVRSAFHVDLPLRALFEPGTVAALANQVEAARRQAWTLEADFPEPGSGRRTPCLSFSQERMWLLNRLEPDGTAYNMPVGVRLRGDCHVAALVASLEEVVRRHEVLRTHFEVVDAQPRPVVQKTVSALPLIDLSGLPSQERDRQAEHLTTTEFGFLFNLDTGPLLRARLLRLGATEHVFLLNLHHIISDGWSMGVLVRELGVLYEACCGQRPSPLPQLPFQYADFACWQRKWQESSALQGQLAYWKERLQGELQPLELPTDFPRSAVQTYRGEHAQRVLSKELSARLRVLSQRQDATLFMILLAAFNVLLSRLSGQQDLLIGTPIAGRHRGGVEDLVGCFLNVLVLRTDLSGNPTFLELLANVRRVALDAYDHQDLPFETLLDEVAPTRDLSRTPLFQVLLNMIDFPVEEVDFRDLEVEFFARPEETSKFDLTLYAKHGEEGIRLDLVYNADLFSTGRMRETMEQFEHLLGQIVERPEQEIDRFSLLTVAAQGILPRPHGELVAEFSESVHQRFVTQALRVPDRPAVVDHDGSWTYGELERWSARLAADLRAHGVDGGEVVAIYAHRSAALVLGVLGVLRAGAAFLILDAGYPAPRLVDSLRRSGSRAWLQLEAAGEPPALLRDSLSQLEVRHRLTLPRRAEGLAALGLAEPEPFDAQVGPDDLAYIAFTSGTSGEPKGIRGRHGSLAHGPRWLAEDLGLGEADRFSMLSGLAHDPLHRDLFMPLGLGSTLYIPDPDEIGTPGWLAGWMNEVRISAANLTPAMTDLLTEIPAGAAQHQIPSLRCALLVGESLARRQVSRLREVAPAAVCVNLYGTTETHQALGYFVVPCDLQETMTGKEVLPLGHGISQVQLLVLTPSGKLAGIGELGEICVRSPYLSLGYLDDPALTEERFLVNPFTGRADDLVYRTGDLGRYLAQGEVEFCGRDDLQVKIRGFRVELGEIKAVLEEHPDVRQGAVLLCEDGQEEHFLAAYVVVGGGRQMNAQDLREHVRGKLPSYMVPATWVELDSLPLTPNGKVDRRALPVPERGDADAQFVAPRNQKEEIIVAIWSQVLGLERIGVDDDFFELGGHSVKATQVISRIREAFDLELSLRALFEEPTVASVARRLDSIRPEAQASRPPALVAAPRDGELPLSFAQERFWFLDQMEPGSPLLNLPWQVRIEGSLDIEVLQRCLWEIAQRHETLRTSFRSEGGQPHQIVAEQPDIALPIVDLRGLSSAERRRLSRRLGVEEAWRSFDLGRGFLLRAVLLRLADDEFLLLMTAHHVVFDAWSAGVFFHELSAHYRAFSQGEPAPLPALPIQYADFASWQRGWLRDEMLAERLGYWKQRLADSPALLELATDRPRPAIRSVRGARRSVQLPESLTAAMDELGLGQASTRFMIMLAAYFVLLERYSGQRDLLVGSPIANRNQAEVEGLLGMFFNFLVLRVDLSSDLDFRDLLGQVREITLEAYANQDLPFEKVLEELQPERDLRVTPLFQITFVYQNVPSFDLEISGLSLHQQEVDTRAANFDLTFFVDDTSDGIRATFEYKSDLFDATTVERMQRHFLRLLEGFVSDPGQPVGRQPMMSAAERHQGLIGWNDTARDFSRRRTLSQIFEAQVERTPEALAVEAEEERLSYRQLDAQANRLARHLSVLGVGPGSLVGIYMERGAGMIEAVLGVLKAGGAYVPLDTSYPVERLQRILSSLEVQHLVASGSKLETIGELLPLAALRHVVCSDSRNSALREAVEGLRIWLRQDFEGLSSAALPPQASADHLAYIIFTSGSTGMPKGVVVRHRPVINLIEWIHRVFEFGPSERLFFVTSLSFDLSVYDIFGTLSTGGTVRVASDAEIRDPERLAQVLLTEPITFWDSAPAALQQLVAFFPKEAVQTCSLRRVFLSGDWIPLALPDQIRKSFPKAQVISLGGATEATVWSNFFPIGEVDPNWLSIPYGVPIQNAHYHVLDGQLQPSAIGVPGDLYIGGECLASGYAEAPRLSASKYLPDPFSTRPGRLYRTGDRARFRADGNIEFLGRQDHQVKIRGFRIELGEIESVLAEHPSVREAVTVVRGESLEERHLVAYAVADSSGSFDDTGKLDQEQVSRWQTIYDETYGDQHSFHDPTFNIAGWNSSYTGLPIPDDEMREWLEGTVESILSLGPKRVLEIGCGSGMLLFGVAPHCTFYHATDLSEVSIEVLQQLLAEQQPPLPQVSLSQRSADDWDGIEAGTFDLILLNSVTQHFPNIDYLVRTLEGAVKVLAPGGSIFVGDVRSWPHLEAFHASVELQTAEESWGRDRFKRLVAERVAQEEELVIGAEFFKAFAEHQPQAMEARTLLRRGLYHNELTRFRYDAILQLKPPGVKPSMAPRPSLHDWQEEGLTLAQLRKILADEEPGALAVRGIPNTRLRLESQILQWLAGEETTETVGEFRREMGFSPRQGWIDPEEFWTLEDEFPYRVEITWGNESGKTFDALLRCRGAQTNEQVSTAGAVSDPSQSPPLWHRYANDPMGAAVSGQLTGVLREHLAERLPEYMVPTVIMVLDSMPLTPNGKIDRKALPEPERERLDLESDFVAPRTPMEELVAKVWAEVIGIEQVGVDHNFFELGGHSLLATQVLSRLREFLQVDLSLRSLFEAPSVATMARMIEERQLEAAAPQLVPVPRDGGLPLSFAQQRLWFIDQFAPASTGYNVPMAVRVEGELDLEILNRSLSAIVQRHESLRTTFEEVDGQPVQVIHQPVPWTLPVMDLSDLPAPIRDATAEQLGREPGRWAFDLRRGPLYRGLLLRLAPQEWVLLVSLHHIISDGWSIGILIEELSALYGALRDEQPSPLSPLPIQYADFAHWQRQWLQGAVLQEQLDYWREELSGVAELLHLPTDRPRPALLRPQSGNQHAMFSTRQQTGLRALGQEQDATLFMALLAAFQTLLHRITGQSDFCVGSPIANRNRSEIEGLIGFFINTLAFRGRLDGQPTFRQLLDRTRDTALNAYAHQDLPFEKLLEELQPSRELSHSPLFQVMLTLQNVPDVSIELEDLSLTALLEDTRPATFDLSLMMNESEEGLHIRCIYNNDLFDRTTICRFLEHFEVLVEGTLTNPDSPLGELPILVGSQRHALLVEWNEPRAEYVAEDCFHHFFELQVAEHPDAVALVCGDEQMSYSQLNGLANRLAHRLRAVGVGPEERVGIGAERCLEMVIGFLGVLKAGGAFVPLAPDLPSERLGAILAATRIRVLLAGEQATALFPSVEAEVMALQGMHRTLGAESSTDPSWATGPDNLAYVMHTSGSTGTPKGVMIPHRGLFNRLAFARAAGHLQSADRFLHKTSLSFDVSVLELFLPLMVGGSSVLAKPGGHQDPQYLTRLMVRQRINQAIFPPSMLQLLVEEEEIVECYALHSVASSAEALPLGLKERFFTRLTAQLNNRYGPTEASIAITSRRCRPGGLDRSVPIGRPIANARLYVTDSALRAVGIGIVGELSVGGICLGRGYFENPASTAEAFCPDPFAVTAGERLYRTGDLVRYGTDGALEFLGRIDHQVKIRGVRIELGEIEATLRDAPEVREAIVVDHPDPKGGRRLDAYVTGEPGKPWRLEELRRWLQERLPSAAVPSAIVRLETLPLLPSGKVDRAALAPPEESESAVKQGPYVAPRSELERVIAGVWREELGIDRVGMQQNFFDLGGHSLLTVRVRNRLQKALDREIPIVDLFTHPTIASLADHLAQDAPQQHPVERARLRLESQPETRGQEEIAIIGMEGRLPGAQNLEEFWRNLESGTESVSFFSNSELAAAGVNSTMLSDPNHVAAGGVLDEIDRFDASFFDLTPREAEVLDPQQRVFLECAWQALETAGYDVERGDLRVGVFAGLGMSSYLANLYSRQDVIDNVGGYQVLISNDKDFLPTRVSYKLGLRGPSVNVQTACSTSLVAVHLACQSLLNGESELALAGGVSITVPQKSGYLYSQGMILSPDGHCRAFDASASGTVRGNGVGIVVLKRLSNALADGDTIHAVIKASAINNDGDLKVGYTAPSVEGQAEVVAEAYARAGVEPSTVSYIETHGTGTPLGDPVEITALKQIFGEGEESQDSIAIGSVKTNIGHLNAAAGVAGLIKTVLALKHRKLPPSLHFERPNPEIDFAASPFYVNTRLAPWDENGSPLRAGVSSFGIGGTNAHAVVERAPERLASASPRDWHLLVLSARSESALQAASENLARHLQENPDLDLADVAYTLQVGRKRFGYRRTMVCQGTSDAVSVLRLAEPSRLYSTREEGAGRPVVFMFPGQGAQHVGMAAALFRSEPTFAAELARCTELLEPLIGFNLRHVLYPEEETTPEETAQRLRQTAVAQPALFATEYALAKLWMSWGIQPEAMVGHSIGELVAACLAGVFDLPDALQVVAARGRLMQELPSGSMLAVSLGEVEVAEFLGPHLSLAAVTGPKLCVLSGSSEAVAELERDLLSREVDCRRLRTSHAFHSKMMAPIVEPLHEVFAGITLRAPTIPFFSNLSGTWITDEEACSSSYWASHARGTVRLAPALQELLAAPERVLLEVGPAQTLSTLARQQLERPAGRVILSSLPHPRDRRDEVRSVFEALGRLWAAGVTIDWQGVWADEQRGRIPLPTYPFERQRFWIEPKASALGAERLGAGAPDDGMATPRPEAVPPPLRQPGENASGHGGAEDPVQRQLVELWEQLLGFAGIGVHDSFFELGGSSLLAVRLNARLEESFGVKLPPHALLESPTVAQLAEMIRESPAVDRQERPSLPSSLVELRPGHQAFPLFLVHPAGGGVYFYRELAAGLDGGQAVYGLRAQGLEEGEQSHSSIEAMAAHYIAALRTVQPDGPYFLGGSSMGGTIAFEMAQQLVGEGQNVALLALLDTPGPGQMPTKLQDDAAILDYLMGGDGPLTLEELRRYPPQDQLEVLLQRAEASNGLPADLTLATAQRLLGLFKTHMGAMREYQPLPYAGHLVFLQATERRITDPEHPERPWIELAEEGIEILRVPGNHISMHQSPHIEVLARRLESCLAAAVVKFLPGEGRRSTPGTSS